MAYLRCTGNSGGSLKLRTAQGEIASFETNIIDTLKEVKCGINATGGNGTPDSPIPINGYTEAKITRCGVNLFDKTTVLNGYINDTTGVYSENADYKCTDFIRIVGGVDYYIKTSQTTSSWGAWYDENKNFISGINAYREGAIKTAPANACYIRLTISHLNNGDVNSFGVNYPATDTTYHPYTGNTYTIAFGQTVYGGVPDVTRGKLHVTHYYKSIGDLNWSYNSGYGFYTSKDSSLWGDYNPKGIANTEIANLKCDIYETDTYQNVTGGITNFHIAQGLTYMAISDNRYNDAATFKTAMSGHYIAYELDTPFDIDLTPVQIEALLGVNNVWHDGNGDTEVKYLYNA